LAAVSSARAVAAANVEPRIVRTADRLEIVRIDIVQRSQRFAHATYATVWLA